LEEEKRGLRNQLALQSQGLRVPVFKSGRQEKVEVGNPKPQRVSCKRGGGNWDKGAKRGSKQKNEPPRVSAGVRSGWEIVERMMKGVGID